jgi:uncharacterized protein with HEPN domain
MPRESSAAAHLWDVLCGAGFVVQFTNGRTFDEYSAEAYFRPAVERQIEIVGQAARRVSDAFQNASPHIPWQKIAVQSHVLAHEYDDNQHDLFQ